VEGLGGDEAFEREIPGGEGEARIPVPAAQGTALVRAAPLGAAGPAAEVRVSIPYRVTAEVLRGEKADPGAGIALLVLRRDYDGAPVEGTFAVHPNDDVGGLSAVGGEGAVVEFRTGFVVEEIRRRAGSAPAAPDFLADGRVRRAGPGGAVRPSSAATPVEIVLRGVGEDRRIVESK
jgi:hypothetical protein